NIMGISVMDHIIVGKNNYFSFRKNGYIRERG
ncbi:MAG: DNA repair protein RadC, partial [bacterium]|nr:DNA repair protein RadC [bacterium]